MSLADLHGKKILLKCDFNIPNLKSVERIEAAMATILELYNQQNTLIIVTHWGRPEGQVMPEWSTQKMLPVLQTICEAHGVNTEIKWMNQWAKGFEYLQDQISRLPSKSIVLLENTRFCPDEEGGDFDKRKILAEQYASLAEVIVDEAFSLSHRHEVTNTDIKLILPSEFGLQFEKEKMMLSQVKNHPKKPLVYLLGGAKLETKLPLVLRVIDQVDALVVGGQLCFTFLVAARNLGLAPYQNVDIGSSLVEQSFLEKASALLEKYGDKIVLPIDFVYDTNDSGARYAADIGPETIRLFEEKLKSAATIFWNGPMGRLEKKPFDTGTCEIAQYLATLGESVFVCVGGGDTVAGLPQDTVDKFGFVSTGGGASLAFLAG